MNIQKEQCDFEQWAFQASGSWASFSKDSHGKYWPDKLNLAWEAWKAAKAQAAPEGFVLVPRESTDAMIKAGYQHCEPNGILPHSFYEAMIEAAEKEMGEAQEQSHD